MVGGGVIGLVCRWDLKYNSSMSTNRYKHLSEEFRAGYTIFEIIIVILIIAVLALTAVAFFYNIHGEAVQGGEQGVVGAVRSGLATYAVESQMLNRQPRYPEMLDDAESGAAAPDNLFFSTIVAPSINSDWNKIDTNRYEGPTGVQYIYDQANGTFAATDPVLASYSFDEGEGDWVVRGTTVAITDGQLVLGDGEWRPENRAFVGDENWTDYTVETDVLLQQGSGYGIFFRAQNPDSPEGYIFQYDPGYGSGTFLFRRWDAGHERSPFARAEPADPDFDWYGVERNVRVEVQGDTFSAYVDGELVLTGTDDTYDSGSVGVRSWHNSLVEFDNMTVTEP